MGKEKSFASNFFIIGSGTLINMLLGLITAPIITRLVDPKPYGQLSIFNMYTNIAVMVLCLGLDQSFVRFFYDYEDESYKKSLLRFCTVIPGFASVVVTAFFLAFVYFGVIPFEFSFTICVALCINIFINIINRMSLLLLRMTYNSKAYSFCLIITRVVYIAVLIPLLLCDNKKALIILVSATVVAIFASTTAAIIIEKQKWNFKNEQSVNSWIGSKQIISYGAPLIISMGVTTIFQSIDKISLNAYCTYNEVGIYSSAMTLVNIFALIKSTFNTLWAPMQIEHFTKHPGEKTFFETANQSITVIMFFIGLSLIFVKDIFALLLGSKYREAAYILPCLCFNPIMYTISETTHSGIEVSKKSYLNIVIAVVACIINFVGNTILVPIFQGRGAAISTGLAYIVFFALRTVFSNKYYYVNYHLIKLTLLTIATFLYAILNTFQKFGFISIIGYIFCVFLMCVLYKDVIYKTLLYIIRELRRMIRWE